MINILVTGANGQLGNELRILAGNTEGLDFTFTDVEDLDITDFQSLEAYFKRHKFDAVINCAAYTAVDKAEEDQVNANMLNVVAPRYLARLTSLHNSLLVHVSTDYVYGGRGYKPYQEDDITSPDSFYANSKLEGEKEVMAHASKYVIIRTSWLYSSFGKNFVKTILQKGRELGKLKVIFDQIGTPTYAADLAKVILNILPVCMEEKVNDVFHYSNEGVCSWYDFALAVVEMSGISCEVTPIETKDYPTPAERPYYSVLNKGKIKSRFGLEIAYWRDSLKICIKKFAK